MAEKLTESPGLMVRLPSELHDALKQQAINEERSMSQIVRRALRAYIAQDPPFPPSS